jgi:hypothetical protein
VTCVNAALELRRSDNIHELRVAVSQDGVVVLRSLRQGRVCLGYENSARMCPRREIKWESTLFCLWKPYPPECHQTSDVLPANGNKGIMSVLHNNGCNASHDRQPRPSLMKVECRVVPRGLMRSQRRRGMGMDEMKRRGTHGAATLTPIDDWPAAWLARQMYEEPHRGN